MGYDNDYYNWIIAQIKQDCWQQHQFPWKVWQKICHWSTWVAKKAHQCLHITMTNPLLITMDHYTKQKTLRLPSKAGKRWSDKKFSIWYVQDLTDANMHDHLWSALPVLHSRPKTNHVGKNLPPKTRNVLILNQVVYHHYCDSKGRRKIVTIQTALCAWRGCSFFSTSLLKKVNVQQKILIADLL